MICESDDDVLKKADMIYWYLYHMISEKYAKYCNDHRSLLGEQILD
ncbi:MAG: hypothetical protein ACLTMR_00090 [Faecalibacillus sp.]